MASPPAAFRPAPPTVTPSAPDAPEAMALLQGHARAMRRRYPQGDGEAYERSVYLER